MYGNNPDPNPNLEMRYDIGVVLYYTVFFFLYLFIIFIHDNQ